MTFKKFLIDTPKVSLPSLFSDGVQDCWEIEGATIDNLIVLADGVDLAFDHSTELNDKSVIDFDSFECMDESAKIFIGRYSNPFVGVLE